MSTVEVEGTSQSAAPWRVGTRFPELFAMLGAEFEPREVKERTQAGRTFRYVSARTIQNRLDNCLGPEGWWPEFKRHENSVECRLTIKLPDGSTLSKTDAGGYAGMADAGDDDKSGFSDSLKRAACMFGIGRYLWADGVPTYVAERTGLDGPALPLSEQAEHNIAHGDPGPARVGPAPSQAPARREPAPAPAQAGNGGPPRTGKALFSWVKDMEQRHDVALLKYLNQFAKIQEWPARMIEWSNEQVALAYDEACRKLKFVEQGRESA